MADAYALSAVHQLVDVYNRVLMGLASSNVVDSVDYKTLCWMVYFWRAIALNGMNMMHLNILRRKGAATIELGWRLLMLRVWAAATECAVFITPDHHPDICESVYSGRPTIMPGWACRGMQVPFIFDILYMIGVKINPSTTVTSILSANYIYLNCFAALLRETTVDTALINGDPFLAQLISGSSPPEMISYAYREYVPMTRGPIMALPLMLQGQTVPETLYNNLLTVLNDSEKIEMSSLFRRIYNTDFDLGSATLMHWEFFYVQ